ncbi:MAG: hypothetical protein PHI11_09610 [Gallionella sp.]|nr:hypothetical protein [Gallionella sp.]
MKHTQPLAFAIAATLVCTTGYAAETDAWTIKTTPQASYAGFSNAATRDSIVSAGLYADMQYLDHGGITMGASHTTLKMKFGAPTLQQNALFLSGRKNFTPDALPGKLTVRADVHRATNNDVTNETNGVNVIAPQVGFMSFDKSYSLDLGYARSRYGNSNIGNGGLSVSQWTPTVGFGFNQGGDWLQVRVYDIHFSNALRAQNASRTDALEVKWTHYLVANGLTPEQIQVGALVGKRLYAVDGDSGALYNLADVQRGSASLGAQWKLAENTRLIAQGGVERYENSLATRYSANYVYAGISQQW